MAVTSAPRSRAAATQLAHRAVSVGPAGAIARSGKPGSTIAIGPCMKSADDQAPATCRSARRASARPRTRCRSARRGRRRPAAPTAARDRLGRHRDGELARHRLWHGHLRDSRASPPATSAAIARQRRRVGLGRRHRALRRRSAASMTCAADGASSEAGSLVIATVSAPCAVAASATTPATSGDAPDCEMPITSASTIAQRRVVERVQRRRGERDRHAAGSARAGAARSAPRCRRTRAPRSRA